MVTIGVVALGIGLFSALAPILENMVDLSERYLKSVGDIIVYQRYTNIYTSQVPGSFRDDILMMEGVRSADSEIVIPLMQSSLLDRNLSVMPYSQLIGVKGQSNIEHGGILSFLMDGEVFMEGENEVVVGARLAELDGFVIGGFLNLFGAPFTIVGIYTTGTLISDAAIVADIDMVREMTILPKIGPGNCSFISVKMDDPTYTSRVSGRIERELSVATSFPRASLSGAMDTINMIRSATATITLVVLLSSFMITSAVLFMNVRERIKEFAMFKAMGWSNRDVIQCVLIEALVLSGLGGTIGIAAGTILTWYLQRFVLSMPLLLQSWRTLTLSIIITIILALVSGSYPAYRASSARPAIIMRGS